MYGNWVATFCQLSFNFDKADVPLYRVGVRREVDLHVGILEGWISRLGGYIRLNDNAQWSVAGHIYIEAKTQFLRTRYLKTLL